jgi:GTPase SAR1 family protein
LIFVIKVTHLNYNSVVIVVGDSTVGKTDIVDLYTKGKVANNPKPTIGVCYASKVVPLREGKRAKVQIWDTAGQ